MFSGLINQKKFEIVGQFDLIIDDDEKILLNILICYDIVHKWKNFRVQFSMQHNPNIQLPDRINFHPIKRVRMIKNDFV